MGWIRNSVFTRSSLAAVISGLLISLVLIAIAATALVVGADNAPPANDRSESGTESKRDFHFAVASAELDPQPTTENNSADTRSNIAIGDKSAPAGRNAIEPFFEISSRRPEKRSPISIAKQNSSDRKFSRRRTKRRSANSMSNAKQAIPSLAMPDYLVPFVDPKFGTKVVRVSDPGRLVPGLGVVWKNAARHHYSVDQAWNADSSLLMLTKGTRGALFLNGQTYQPLFRLDSPGNNRWHPGRPDFQIYVRHNSVALWNVRTNQHENIARFPGYSGFRFGPGKGVPSNDGTMIAVLARAPDKRLVAFAYDLAAKRKYPDIDLSGHKRVSYVTISPLGKYLVVHGTLTGSANRKGDTTQIHDLQGKPIGPMWRLYGRPSHFDLTVDENGDEVAVGVSKSGPEKRRIIKRRLRDGAVTPLTGRGYASHTSARNIRKPGWVFVSYSVDKKKRNRDPYNSEIVAVPLDGSMKVRRIAQTRSVGFDEYLAEPHGSPSPDGTKVIWASNWGVRRGPIGAYVAELPANALSSK